MSIELHRPKDVPHDVWSLFVREADKVRATGRDHYGARTIMEVIRHHQVIDQRDRDFVINNNWQAEISRAYMRMRGCFGFFEIRDRRHDEVAA